VALLEENFNVNTFYFNPNNKFLVPFEFIKQFFVAGIRILKADIVITQFAGYQSFLPAFFAKIFSKPCLIVLGGSDCVSFPSINYGNFNRPVLKTFTIWSLRLATHFAPVHKSLVESNYTYTKDDYSKQGYKIFCPKAKGSYTELFYGYDSKQFRNDETKISNSFITVGFLNYPNFYRKGIDLIIEMAKAYPLFKFTVVGGTINDIPIDTVPSNVELIDSLTYDKLKSLYAKHEFYLQLSICEGFPSAICEAMLCGCIPIGSDVAAIPEIIDNCGFVLKHKDVDALKEVFQSAILCDKESMSTLSRNNIKNRFPLDERNKFIDLVRKLIK
jgi:glycosyltransferase involved in cell wall biosynthesis